MATNFLPAFLKPDGTRATYLEATWEYWLSSPKAPQCTFEEYVGHMQFAYGTLGLRPEIVFERYSRPLLMEDSEMIIRAMKLEGRLSGN